MRQQTVEPGLVLKARLLELGLLPLGVHVAEFAQRWESENGPASERPYYFAAAFALSELRASAGLKTSHQGSI